MAIPLKKETPDSREVFGCYEVCVFCKKTTDTWHERTNNPVCPHCSKEHKVSELRNWRKNK